MRLGVRPRARTASCTRDGGTRWEICTWWKGLKRSREKWYTITFSSSVLLKKITKLGLVWPPPPANPLKNGLRAFVCKDRRSLPMSIDDFHKAANANWITLRKKLWSEHLTITHTHTAPSEFSSVSKNSYFYHILKVGRPMHTSPHENVLTCYSLH